MTKTLSSDSVARLREREGKASTGERRMLRKLFRSLLRNRYVLFFWLRLGAMCLRIVVLVIRVFHAA
jgi:hypothetical protein